MDDKTIFNLIADLTRKALLSPSGYLAPLVYDAESLEISLDDLDLATQAIIDSDDLIEWTEKVSDWVEKYKIVANEAFSNIIDNQANELIVRFMQSSFPRTTATLFIAGVITTETDTSVVPPIVRNHIDWGGLKDFILEPETLINEDTWEDLFADLGSPHSGKLLAVFAGMLIMAPRTLLAIARGELSFLGPNAPPVRGDAALPWSQFRGVSDDWISLNYPFADPTVPNPNPENSYYLQSGITPDIDATVALRSNRSNIGNQTVTDFEMWLALSFDSDRRNFDLGDDWYLRVEPGIGAGFGRDGTSNQWHGAFAPIDINSPLLPDNPDDPVTISIGRELADSKPDIMFGPPYDTRLIIKDLEFFLKIREASPQFEIGAKVEEFALVIAPRVFRSTVPADSLFREGIKFGLDLDLAYGVGRGVTLNLSSDLEFVLFLNWMKETENFSIKLHTIRFTAVLHATEDSFSARVNITFHISGHIGPVTLVVDGLGMWIGTDMTDHDWQDWLIPPTGAGISIEIGPVIGGGFIDWKGGPTERYAGLIYVKISGYEVKAFAVHEKLANDKTAVVIVLGVTFTPGIPLAYGFSITGFGGLVAINRRLDTDALRERLTSGAVGNILFAPDPVRNAPIILGDLEALFPTAENVHVAGPTMRISWLSTVHFDIGLLFEIVSGTTFEDTQLTKIVLLGSVHSKLVTEGKIITDIQMDLSGFVDTVKEVVEFDASLVRSKLFEIFTITGDCAFRTAWGEHNYTLLTMGGFHPRFNPEPAQFPDLARLGLAFDDKDSGLSVRFEFYYAFTSNTIQMGWLVEVFITKGLTAKGWVSMDALIQFDPFMFEVKFAAGFRVSIKSITLAGVKISGIISGPGPIRISGAFCIEILFFDICWEDSFTIGEVAPPVIIGAVSSLLQVLETELNDTSNLTSSLTGDQNIIASDSLASAEGLTVISPIGNLSWSQRKARLEVLLSRLEGSPFSTGAQGVIASSPFESGKVLDLFAPGQGRDLTSSEALNTPAFEEGVSGIKLGFEMEHGMAVARKVDIHQFVLPKKISVLLPAYAFPVLVLDSAYGRTATSKEFNIKDERIKTHSERWEIRSAEGNVVMDNLARSDAYARTNLAIETALPEGDVVDLGIM